MERPVTHLADELAGLHIENKMVEADSREGIALTEVYDLTQRPAVIVATDEGTQIQSWQGAELPAADDISYFVHQ